MRVIHAAVAGIIALAGVGAATTATFASTTDATATSGTSKAKKITGELEYLAPGKIIVNPGHGKTGRILWLANDTKVIDRLGDICAARGRALSYTCTPAQLEKTLKKNKYAIYATVTHKNGVAVKVVGLVED
ncbi:hypothetical protein [Sinosporangium album]|nr:hypothetical protein [Sinosporangium album]